MPCCIGGSGLKTYDGHGEPMFKLVGGECGVSDHTSGIPQEQLHCLESCTLQSLNMQ